MKAGGNKTKKSNLCTGTLKLIRRGGGIYMPTTSFDLSVSVLHSNDENCEFTNIVLFILWGNQYETKPPGFYLFIFLFSFEVLCNINGNHRACLCVHVFVCVLIERTVYSTQSYKKNKKQ